MSQTKKNPSLEITARLMRFYGMSWREAKNLPALVARRLLEISQQLRAEEAIVLRDLIQAPFADRNYQRRLDRVLREQCYNEIADDDYSQMDALAQFFPKPKKKK